MKKNPISNKSLSGSDPNNQDFIFNLKIRFLIFTFAINLLIKQKKKEEKAKANRKKGGRRYTRKRITVFR